MIILTILTITFLLLGNGMLANLYNELFPISTKRVKCILLIPPMAILLWMAVTLVMIYMSIQSGLVKYFKEGDE